jgi:hypothetical protein
VAEEVNINFILILHTSYSEEYKKQTSDKAHGDCRGRGLMLSLIGFHLPKNGIALEIKSGWEGSVSHKSLDSTPSRN